MCVYGLGSSAASERGVPKARVKLVVPSWLGGGSRKLNVQLLQAEESGVRVRSDRHDGCRWMAIFDRCVVV